jgi:muconolactone delta-isomerase
MTTKREPFTAEDREAARQGAEKAARTMARRHGWVLRKSRRRNSEYPDYGLYNLFDPDTGGTILAQNTAVLSPFNWTLEQIVSYLNEEQ